MKSILLELFAMNHKDLGILCLYVLFCVVCLSAVCKGWMDARKR